MEFFGVPLNEGELHDAPLKDILGACHGVLKEMKRGDIYESHFKRIDDGPTRCSFYKALASLPPEDQQKCFDEIVGFLRKSSEHGFEGFEHIAERLIKGNYFLRHEDEYRLED